MGLDETSFLKANRFHATLLITGFVDLDRSRLVDVVAGHSAAAVSDWLDTKPTRWKAGIGTVALDPFRGYAKGIREGLPHARQVIDHFHAIRLANVALDDVRRRVQQDTLGHRGRKGDPLYRIRRLLLVGHERLSQRGWQRVEDGLRLGDPAGEVGAAYLAKELFRETYATRSSKTVERRLARFYRHCHQADIDELARLAKTIRSWHNEILAYHTTGLTNAATEGTNNDGVDDVVELGELAGDVEVGEPVERFEGAITVVGEVEAVEFLEGLPACLEPWVGGEELVEAGLVVIFEGVAAAQE